MNYRITLVYNDGNSINVEVPEDEYQQVMECLENKNVFWGKDQKQGFWTNIQDVRYMQIFQLENSTAPADSCVLPEEEKTEGCCVSESSDVGE